MTAFEGWMKQGTRRLSKDSTAQVRIEIRDHYESAREAAMSRGVSADEADRMAVAALGDPKLANRQYRKVLLTSAEAKMLRDGNCEAQAICSRPWLRSLTLATSIAALAAALAFFVNGATEVAAMLLAIGLGIGFLLAAPFLPIYTPPRARVFRVVKWVALAGLLVLAYGPDTLKWSWLFLPCLWPMAWAEWTRVSIRRKLPVDKWPRQLYL